MSTTAPLELPYELPLFLPEDCMEQRTDSTSYLQFTVPAMMAESANQMCEEDDQSVEDDDFEEGQPSSARISTSFKKSPASVASLLEEVESIVKTAPLPDSPDEDSQPQTTGKNDRRMLYPVLPTFRRPDMSAVSDHAIFTKTREALDKTKQALDTFKSRLTFPTRQQPTELMDSTDDFGDLESVADQMSAEDGTKQEAASSIATDLRTFESLGYLQEESKSEPFVVIKRTKLRRPSMLTTPANYTPPSVEGDAPEPIQESPTEQSPRRTSRRPSQVRGRRGERRRSSSSSGPRRRRSLDGETARQLSSSAHGPKKSWDGEQSKPLSSSSHGPRKQRSTEGEPSRRRSRREDMLRCKSMSDMGSSSRRRSGSSGRRAPRSSDNPKDPETPKQSARRSSRRIVSSRSGSIRSVSRKDLHGSPSKQSPGTSPSGLSRSSHGRSSRRHRVESERASDDLLSPGRRRQSRKSRSAAVLDTMKDTNDEPAKPRSNPDLTGGQRSRPKLTMVANVYHSQRQLVAAPKGASKPGL